jgi:putative transposase
MRKQFTDSQIVSVLKKHESGISARELAREAGVSEATIYNWKAKFGGMEVADVKRLKELEAAHSELKKMYAELSIENRAIKALLEKKF